jgi:purine nucleoside phosphorylase
MTADLRVGPPLGIIGGSAFLDAVALEGAHTRGVITPYGVVTLHDAGDFVLLRRHGEDRYRPPPRITHHAHVAAFESLGVRIVAGFASVGSTARCCRTWCGAGARV